jgi:hypothetical protein
MFWRHGACGRSEYSVVDAVMKIRMSLGELGEAHNAL